MKPERCLPLVYRQEAVFHNKIIARIDQISAVLLERQRYFLPLYPVDDVRPWTFQKMAQILAYYRLSLCYSVGVLSRTDNLGRILGPHFASKLSLDKAGPILKEYEQYLTFSFFHVAFSSFEGSMRSIVGRVVIMNHKGKRCRETDKFSDVYHSLINYTGVDEKYRDLFELLLMIRNCIHNRSMYFSDKGSRSMAYNGKTYDFVQGKHIEFATIELFFVLLLDVKEFFEAIYASDALQREAHIQDDVL